MAEIEMFFLFVTRRDPNPPSYGYTIWDSYNGDDVTGNGVRGGVGVVNKNENYLKFFVDPETGRNLQKENGNPNKEGTTFWNDLLPSVEKLSMEKMNKLNELLILAGNSNVGGHQSGKYEFFLNI